MSIQAFRFQLRLQPGTERVLRRFAGSCRWVWNAAIARQQHRLKRYQRAVSRKVKASRNRRKVLDRLGHVHAGIAVQHSDWLHPLGCQCGHVPAGSGTMQARCVACGHAENADTNAAKKHEPAEGWAHA